MDATRSPFLRYLPYAILAILTPVVIYLTLQLSQIINEQRAFTYNLCVSQNDNTRTLAVILDDLAAPRPDDEPGEHEERQRLRRLVDPHLQLMECNDELSPEGSRH